MLMSKHLAQDISSKTVSLEESVFTSPHVLQMLPQDLSCSTVGHEAQESLSVQATQLTSLQASQV